MVYEVQNDMNGNALTIYYNGELIATLNLMQTLDEKHYYHLVSVYADGRAIDEVLCRIFHKSGKESLYGGNPQMSDFKLKQVDIYVSSMLKECQTLETYCTHRKEERIVDELQAQIRVLKQVQKFVSSLL